MTAGNPSSSRGMTIVMRDRPGASLAPTAKLCTLMPVAATALVTRVKVPGRSATYIAQAGMLLK